jgi:hypothetical protein
MHIFWVITEVNLDVPLKSGGLDDAIGFFQTFGCTADSEAKMAESVQIELNKEEWVEVHGAHLKFDISIIEPGDVEREILMDEEINEYILSPPSNIGIWYKSGKAFFGKDDEEDAEMHIVEVVPNDAH